MADKITRAISTSTLSISSALSDKLSQLFSSVSRCGDVVTVFATFTVTSDIVGGAATEMFSGLVDASRINNQWVLAYCPEQNKITRIQVRGNSLYENWADFPAGQYHIIPFSYIAS